MFQDTKKHLISNNLIDWAISELSIFKELLSTLETQDNNRATEPSNL